MDLVQGSLQNKIDKSMIENDIEETKRYSKVPRIFYSENLEHQNRKGNQCVCGLKENEEDNNTIILMVNKIYELYPTFSWRKSLSKLLQHFTERLQEIGISY